MGNFFSSNGEFLESIPRLLSKRLIEVGGRRSAEAVNRLLTGLTATVVLCLILIVSPSITSTTTFVDGAAWRVVAQMTNVRKLTLPEKRIRPFIS